MEEPSHPIFKEKPDDDAKLWRYLSFASFISLLQTSFLHFTRLDKFDDHFEGVWPKSDLEYFQGLKGFNVPSHTEKMKRTTVAASCWIEQPHESAAMWRLYAPGREGVAITTTFGKLNAVVSAGVESDSISNIIGLSGVGRVQYFDHANEGLINVLRESDTLPNTLVPFMLKNVSYEHEKEVRALLIAKQDHAEILDEGCYIEVKNEYFIDEIVVSPFSQRWFSRAVADAAYKYNLNQKIKQSTLSPDVFYMQDTETAKD